MELVIVQILRTLAVLEIKTDSCNPIAAVRFEYIQALQFTPQLLIARLKCGTLCLYWVLQLGVLRRHPQMDINDFVDGHEAGRALYSASYISSQI